MIAENRGGQRAVAPVIAVVLFVALVVVLGVVVTTFVLLIGDTATEPAPNAAFQGEATEDDTIELVHMAGSTLDGENIEIRGGIPLHDIPETVDAGDTIEVAPAGETVDLVWHNEDGDNSAVIDSTTNTVGPNPLAATGTAITWERDDADGSYTGGGSSINDIEIAGDTVFTASSDDVVTAIDRSDGSTRWVWEDEQGRQVYSVNEQDGVVYGSTRQTGGATGWTRYPPIVFALDADDGTKIWNHTYHNDSRDVWALEESDGIVYSGDYDGKVVAADAENGQEIWNHTIEGEDRIRSIHENDGVVYVGDRDGTVTAIDSSNGSPIWNYSHHQSTVWSIDTADGVIYTGSHWDNRVVAADISDGSKIWDHTIHENTVRSVREDSGVLYSGSDDDTVVAVDASDGSKMWSHTKHDYSVYTLVVEDNTLYSGDRGGFVFAQELAY